MEIKNIFKKTYLSHGQDILLGTDPELFFSDKDGKIVASENVLPKEGIPIRGNGLAKIVRDGVQVEFNTSAYTCRQSLAFDIQDAFRVMSEVAKEKGLLFNFSTVVKLSDKDIEKLSPEARTLGCQPSLNIYEKDAKINVDPKAYQYRSAGGHVHLGRLNINGVPEALNNPEKVIPLLDAIVGNTCVMIDRDPRNKKRREVYGRAGEYRIQPHGLEYRTLSNFWLRSYPLMSLVFSLSRLAVHIVAQDKEGGFVKKMEKVMDQESIREAINSNDIKLARYNFAKIAPVINEMLDPQSSYFTYLPFEERSDARKGFEYFVKMKTEHWFPEAPEVYWAHHSQSAGFGWENYLAANVITQMKKPEIKVTPILK